MACRETPWRRHRVTCAPSRSASWRANSASWRRSKCPRSARQRSGTCHRTCCAWPRSSSCATATARGARAVARCSSAPRRPLRHSAWPRPRTLPRAMSRVREGRRPEGLVLARATEGPMARLSTARATPLAARTGAAWPRRLPAGVHRMSMTRTQRAPRPRPRARSRGRALCLSLRRSITPKSSKTCSRPHRGSARCCCRRFAGAS
mmetsp:Transcript_6647/g.19434  ORF Transcript_6647/g.19434 Transcript_6647/m.19434 type:complete len:206 (-) Transcript_6647:1892-2509(-)